MTDNPLVEAVTITISGQDAAGWQELPEDDREIWEHSKRCPQATAIHGMSWPTAFAG